MPAPEPVVFVVDDDVSVRDALIGLVSAAGWSVHAYPSAQEFLDAERAVSASCLVLDVSLPGLDGLQLQARLNEIDPGLPIIFITGQGDIPISVRAMKAGAVEFLTKPIDSGALLDAIANAIERSSAAIGARAHLELLRLNYSSLTKREREVMALIASGRLNKQAGGDLGIAEVTVKAHRAQVMQKMNAHSFAELVTMATALGLAHPEQA
jgi:FixJ family two-component response regulator